MITFRLLSFQPTYSVKELCDLYRHFQSSYYREVESHMALKGKMGVKEAELTTTKDDLKVAKEEVEKAWADLQLANVLHTQIMQNKDTELKKLMKELRANPNIFS